MLTQNKFLVLALLLFVALMLLLEGAVLLWRSHHGPHARKLKQRLQEFAPGDLHGSGPRIVKSTGVSALPSLDKHLRRFSGIARVERLLGQAGLTWTVSRLLLTSLLLAIAGVMAGTQLRPYWQPAPFAGMAFGVLPILFVLNRRERRLNRIGQQLPDALDLITRALRAGHAFSASLKMAAEELPEPIAGEFRAVHDEVTYGVSMPQALTNLSERVPITDMRYFVVAVLVQLESGGNLTEILSGLSYLIRERAKLMGRIRVLSAEGRMSAWILGLLPFALGGALYAINPKFMGPMFTDPIGISILKYLFMMMTVGMLVLRRIIRIRV